MKRLRSGMLLLEVMLGTAILGIAAVALVTLLKQTVETVRLGRETERRTSFANETLNRLVVRSAAQLEASVGRAREGRWNVDVAIVAPQVYSLIVRDTLTNAVVLQTSVYRAGRPADAH